jgi:hypothetical protein
VETVYPLRRFTVGRVNSQIIRDVNPFDNQHVVLFLNFTLYIRGKQAIASRNFARFQRATKGTGQSAARRGHQIIQRGGVGIVDVRIHAVMLSNFGMDPQQNRFLYLRQVGSPQRPFDTLDANV